MLIHGHDAPTGGRIPSSLLDTYVRYKQDTRAIIAWLLSHGTRKHKGLKVVSIRDLVNLASIVQRKAAVMPATIDFHFREAIAARTQLTKFFRQRGRLEAEDRETVNHEFFTESLSQIYSGLCQCCAKPEEHCDRNHEKICSDEKSKPANRYENLQCEPYVKDFTSKETTIVNPSNPYIRSESGGVPTAKLEMQIVGDTLSEAFEIRKQLQEMNDLMSAVKGIWEQAATGQISMVIGSFLTNVAFAMFEEIESRLKGLCNGPHLAILRMKAVQGDTENGHSVEGGHEGLVERLQSTSDVLSKFLDRRAAHPLPKNSQITVRKGPGSSSIDRECHATMLENIGRYMQNQRMPPLVVLNGSPLYADIGYLLSHKDNDADSLRSSYGLQVLLESYKSYLLTSGTANTPSRCRLQALKFAQEIAKSIDPVLEDSSMPCRCPQTLAFHLENFQGDLQAFMKEKLFDLYFQNPWVSGSHVLEMLEMTFYYGLRLFSYRHFVGSVLHVYNILRRVIGFQEIPLLEKLCDVFNDIMFPGGRPERNFRACCMRYMGGRLKFNGHATDHKSGCHKFEIPAHSAKATAGLSLHKEANDSRFQYRKISLIHSIKEKGYHIDSCLWDRAYQLDRETGHVPEKSKKRAPCHHRHPSNYTSFSGSPEHHLCQLQRSVLTEFTGPFPIAKINFFEVYMSCVRIVSIISDKAHDDNDPGTRCLCFLEAVVTAADRYKDNEHKLQPFGHKELVKNCKDAMIAVIGDRPLEDFVWKGIETIEM